VAQCRKCSTTETPVNNAIGFCRSCLLQGNSSIKEHLTSSHAKLRQLSGLPSHPPRAEGGPVCQICARSCQPAPGEKGYCGLRKNQAGKINNLAGIPARGLLEYYYDPLPTNCVSDFVCPVKKKDPLYQRKSNLAVFYGACVLNCHFCQNWHYRSLTESLKPLYSASELAGKVDDSTACICFFGGDPAPQVPHAIATVRRALKRKPDLTICWETSGLLRKVFLQKMITYSLLNDGTIKFDLKAFNREIYYALTGADNKAVLDNFRLCAKVGREKNVTLAVASTLLVPGYIEAEEVFAIASFIADQDPNIPYSLLGFHPSFQMQDLPPTSRRQAEACYQAAREAGLKRIKLGNTHLFN